MGGFVHMMAWLCLILALLFVALYLVKRYGAKAGLPMGIRNEMKMLGQLSLGPKRNLVVVRFLNKILVLGVTDTQINLVTEMDADDTTQFADVLDNENKRSSAPHSG